MSERRFALMSLGFIASVANAMTEYCVGERREYWMEAAVVATLTAYLYRTLTKLVIIWQERHLRGYARRAAGIEVDG